MGRRANSAVLSAVLLTAGPLAARAQECPEVEAGWGPGWYEAVAVAGDLAVVGAGLSVLVYDVVDPAHPRLLGELRLTDFVRRVALSGGYAYAAVDEAGLHVIDLSQPAVPRLAAVVPVPGAARAVAIAGQTAVVADSAAGLLVVDITDPTRPVIVGVASTPGEGFDVAVGAGHAVLAEGSSGVRIFELSDPTLPHEVGRWSRAQPHAGESAVRVAVADGIAFVASRFFRVAGKPPMADAWLDVLDLCDPAHPSWLGSTWVVGGPTAVAVSGDHVYLGAYRLHVVDVSDPTDPVVRSSTDGRARDLTIRGDLLWQAAWERGLVGVDVSDPDAPVSVGEHTAADRSIRVVAFSGLGVLHGDTGLHVLDLARPGAPFPIGRFTEITDSRGLAVTGRLALSMKRSALSLVDYSDPARPRSAGEHIQWGKVFAYTASAGAAYLGLEDSLVVVNLSDGNNPVPVAAVPMTSRVQNLAVDGRRLFVSTREELIAFDVADPATPAELGRHEIPDCWPGLDVRGGVAVVACYDHYRIFDVSDPTAITEVGFLEWEGSMSDVALAGRHAILLESEPDTGEFLRVVDIADPSRPVEVGRRAIAGNRVASRARLVTGGSRVYVAGGGSVLEVFSTGSCWTASPVADFAWRPEVPFAGQPVDLVDLASGFPGSWQWELGDGFTSLRPSPSHVFTTPGTHTVTLTVANHLGSDTTSRDLVVQQAQEAPPLASAEGVISVIPAVAHTTGVHGTRWVTDVVLHNPGVGRTAADLYLLETGRNNSAAAGYRVAVEAGHSLVLDDVVAHWFGETETSGAIVIASRFPLLATSRTFTRSGHGSYGQLIPATAAERAFRGTDPARLIHLTEDSGYRTNLGLVNPGTEAIDVRVDLHDPSGTLVGQRSYRVPARGHVQHSSFLAPVIGAAYAVATAAMADASYFAYASVIDNRSGDPTFLAPVEPIVQAAYVPAAAHVDGLNGTRWRTDLELCATGLQSIACSVELLPVDQDNGDPVTVTVAVPAMGCLRHRDALGTLFGFTGTAALRLTPDGTGLVATSRTYNDAPSGTFGQAVPAVSVEAVPPGGQAVRLSHLAHSPDPGAGSRTNIGVLNAGPEPLEVLVDLYAGDGSFLGRRPLWVPPHALHQESDVFRHVTTAGVDGGSAIVGTSTSRPFIAYASVVDNVTGDPVYVAVE